MLTASLGIVIGLTVLAFAADQFVIGAVRLSVKARIAPVIVGAVIVGFGTSLPEFVVSGLASYQAAPDLAVANVIGSNSANLALVFGVAVLMTRMQVPTAVVRRELPIALATTVLFAIVLQQPLSVWAGVMLAVAFAISLTVMIVGARNDFHPSVDPAQTPHTFTKLRLFGGLAATLAGAQLLIVSARTIATELGFTEGFVGLTLVAIGTSLPELATTIAAARRNHTALIVGNLLGSNLFNATAVGAVAVVFAPGVTVAANVSGTGTLVMLTISALVAVTVLVCKSVPRSVGILLIAVYVASIPLVF
jgi:cation:H+ antiporter